MFSHFPNGLRQLQNSSRTFAHLVKTAYIFIRDFVRLGIPFPWLCFTKFNSCAARDWWKYYFLVIMEFISRGIVLGNVLWTSLRDTGINLGGYICLHSEWYVNVEYYFLLKLYEWIFVKKIFDSCMYLCI